MRNKILISLVVLTICTPLVAADIPAKVPGVEVFKVAPGASRRAFDYAESGEGARSDQLVTMVVRDADIGAVLQLIGSQFNLNILTTAEVKGNVTFQFTNVPLQTAIDVLVKAGACNYFLDGDVIMVKPIKYEVAGELETRIYNLSYAEAADIKASLNRVMSTRGNAEVSYRRVADGGSSKRSSVLLVSDYHSNLVMVDKLVAELDVPVPQVAIEAKFVQTTLTSSDLYGISWDVIVGANAKVPQLGNFKKGDELTVPIHLDQLLLGTINFGQLAAVLDLLSSKGNARLLANPRAITLDNQTATMTMSTQVPIREVRIDPGTQSQTITWKQQSIPISLTVTPHVLPDGTIDMQVYPRVEAITGYVGTATDRQPITSKREAQTQIRVRDGEVAVIGGLVQDEVTRSIQKVPLLGDIPIIGELFKHTQVENSKTELIIFIIPHVLPAQ